MLLLTAMHEKLTNKLCAASCKVGNREPSSLHLHLAWHLSPSCQEWLTSILLSSPLHWQNWPPWRHWHSLRWPKSRRGKPSNVLHCASFASTSAMRIARVPFSLVAYRASQNSLSTEKLTLKPSIESKGSSQVDVASMIILSCKVHELRLEDSNTYFFSIFAEIKPWWTQNRMHSFNRRSKVDVMGSSLIGESLSVWVAFLHLQLDTHMIGYFYKKTLFSGRQEHFDSRYSTIS